MTMHFLVRYSTGRCVEIDANQNAHARALAEQQAQPGESVARVILHANRTVEENAGMPADHARNVATGAQVVTTRERKEARAERLREWAEKREVKSDALHAAGDLRESVSGIPFGQPILVGHHSERRHRNAIEKAHNATRRAIENDEKAGEMARKADNIEAAAAVAIYSDDVDAKERLVEKIERLEAKRAQMKSANAAYRKAHKDELKALTPYGRNQALPFPSYALTNLGATIRNAQKRLADIESGAAARRAAAPRTIIARYGGACSDCGATLERGELIRYDKANGARCAQECTS